MNGYTLQPSQCHFKGKNSQDLHFEEQILSSTVYPILKGLLFTEAKEDISKMVKQHADEPINFP